MVVLWAKKWIKATLDVNIEGGIFCRCVCVLMCGCGCLCEFELDLVERKRRNAGGYNLSFRSTYM